MSVQQQQQQQQQPQQQKQQQQQQQYLDKGGEVERAKRKEERSASRMYRPAEANKCMVTVFISLFFLSCCCYCQPTLSVAQLEEIHHVFSHPFFFGSVHIHSRYFSSYMITACIISHPFLCTRLVVVRFLFSCLPFFSLLASIFFPLTLLLLSVDT